MASSRPLAYALLLLSLACLLRAQIVSTTDTIVGTTLFTGSTTPFFSATGTFTPTATGASATGGTITTITNSADLFSFTRPAGSIPPTGNITAVGLSNSANNLQPDPTDLQRAGATKPQVLFTSLAIGTLASLFFALA